jgi:hypothetical protein
MKKTRQDFYIEQKGKRWRRTELSGIKLAFVCAEAGQYCASSLSCALYNKPHSFSPRLHTSTSLPSSCESTRKEESRAVKAKTFPDAFIANSLLCLLTTVRVCIVEYIWFASHLRSCERLRVSLGVKYNPPE